MADMHQIRLYQSTWADAQRLMYRWGAWGHYDGSCTAAECRYEINLTDASWRSWDGERNGIRGWLWRNKFANLIYRWLGGRYAIVHYAFIVQDGTIWRTITWIHIEATLKLLDMDDPGYLLSVGTKSQQALRRSEGGGWVLGGDDQLADHPYYKAGRPGACEGCLSADVTYSTHTPQSEIDRLTTFDFSCLTRLISCKVPEELLPAAWPWHLYDDNQPNYRPPQPASSAPKSCDIPLWALSRDTGTVLVVNVLSTSQEKGDGEYEYEISKVKVVASLKNTKHWPVGSVLNVQAFDGDLINPPYELAEHLTPGKTYVLLPHEDVYGERDRYSDDSQIVLPRCGVQEDTSEVRRELEKGFVQNDKLRGPELR